MKKIVSIIFFMLLLISCSSSDDSNNGGGGQQAITTMVVDLDGDEYSLRTTDGGKYSIATGGSYGLDYQLLYGYYWNGVGTNARIPDTSKKIEVFLAIPKADISIGEHTFSSTIVVDEYFAELKIKTNNIAEVITTKNGTINVLDYDPITGEISGTFEFITKDSNGDDSHVVSGTFDYIIEEN